MLFTNTLIVHATCLFQIQAMNITVNNTVSTVAALSRAINETEPADQLQVNFVVVVQVFQAVAAMSTVQGPLTISDERQVCVLCN